MKIIIVLLSLTVSGCATPEGWSKVMNGWLGSSETQLVDQWGPPLRSYQINEKKKALTYVFDGGTTGVTTYSYGMASTSYSQNYCKTDFYVEDGIVNQWRSEGNMCKAYDPDRKPLLSRFGL